MKNILGYSLLFTALPIIAYATALRAPETKIILLDKKQQEYRFQKKGFAKHGRGSITYSLKSGNDKETVLYSSNYDPVSGGCGETPEKKKMLALEIGGIVSKPVFTDLNRDDCIDISLKIKEETCVSGDVREYEKNFLCTENGFTETKK